MHLGPNSLQLETTTIYIGNIPVCLTQLAIELYRDIATGTKGLILAHKLIEIHVYGTAQNLLL
jgi:hypothetical protein